MTGWFASIRRLPCLGSVRHALPAVADDIERSRAAVTLAVATAAARRLDAVECDYAITRAALDRRRAAAHYRPAGG